MRTISLRQFRDSIADLTEPVTVQRRDKAGNFQVLGEWRPLSAGVPAAVYPEAGSYFSVGDAERMLKQTPKDRQAERDAILRKINRGG